MDKITGNISPINIITGNITSKENIKTNGMKMTDDVIIKEIPYYETSNESGGSTVYIAGTIDFS